MTRGLEAPLEACAWEDPWRRKAEDLLVGMAEEVVNGKEHADVAQQLEGHGRIHPDEAGRLCAPRGGNRKSVSDRWPTQVGRALTVSALLCQDTPSPPVQRGRFRSGSDEPQISVSR